MKAFLVKSHPYTNTLPWRWSVQCEGQKREFYNEDDGDCMNGRSPEETENMVRHYISKHLKVA